MDTENTTADLSAQIEALPDDAADAFLELHRGSFRVTLVPGYRTETIFGRPTGCAHAYPNVLHASGLAQTNTSGAFEIDVAHLLHCVGPGAPMPGGLRSPVVVTKFNPAEVPGSGTLPSGAPVTVITGSGAKPALFTATPDGFTTTQPPGDSGFYRGWRLSTRELSGQQKVTIRSFQPDGTVFPRAGFNWHLTLEVLFYYPKGVRSK
jgi:hypothetical protein